MRAKLHRQIGWTCALVCALGVAATGCDALRDEILKNPPSSGGGVGSGGSPSVPPSKPPATGVCVADSDCAAYSNYCGGCGCEALPIWQKPALCDKPLAECLRDPCGGETAVCSGGVCVLKGATPVPPPPSQPACQGMSEQGSCRPDSDWKVLADKNCSAAGLVLTDIGYASDSACGSGSSSAVKYTCCKPSDPTPVPPPPGPKPSPSPGVCTTSLDGGPSSCKSSSTWKEYASQYCADKGQTLTNLSFGESCGADLYREMKYECCAPANPPPDAVCKIDADCPRAGVPCKLCADGSSACPVVSCEAGQCNLSVPGCSAPPADPACKSAADCVAPQVCKACDGGGASCAIATCEAGACAVSYPACPPAK